VTNPRLGDVLGTELVPFVIAQAELDHARRQRDQAIERANRAQQEFMERWEALTAEQQEAVNAHYADRPRQELDA